MYKSLGFNTYTDYMADGIFHDRLPIFLVLYVFYEFLFTCAWGGTLGHKGFNMRIKRADNPGKNLHFIDAIIRIPLKITIGWTTYLTRTFNSKGQALNDKIIGSIVLFRDEK